MRTVAGLLVTALAISTCQTDAPTNVVLIVIDDMGWMDSGIYGSAFYETPNIDRLAASGARFTQFYTASPVCSPTRASLMTGKHPARLRITNWIGGQQNGLLLQAEYDRQLPLEEITIGEAFREAGYATGYIGKWHLGVGQYRPEAQGFDFTFAVNDAGQPGSYFYPYENDRASATSVPDLDDGTEGDYLTDRLTDAALTFLEEHHDDPFLLVLSHYAVHTPQQSKESVTKKYETKAKTLGAERDDHFRAEGAAITKLRQDHAEYGGMIESTDESVGRILDALDELQIAGRTVVVFVSDNGGLSTLTRRSFNLATSNEPLRAGKGWLYEGGIRAPLVIRWPGIVPAGTVVDAPTMSTDIYPTLLEMAGQSLREESHLDGVSLTGTMLGRGRTSERPLFWHFPHYHGSGNVPSGAVRRGDYKLIEWFETGRVELYDVRSDTSEMKNLAEIDPQLTNELRELLHGWRGEVGAAMPTPNSDYNSN